MLEYIYIIYYIKQFNTYIKTEIKYDKLDMGGRKGVSTSTVKRHRLSRRLQHCCDVNRCTMTSVCEAKLLKKVREHLYSTQGM